MSSEANEQFNRPAGPPSDPSPARQATSARAKRASAKAAPTTPLQRIPLPGERVDPDTGLTIPGDESVGLDAILIAPGGVGYQLRGNGTPHTSPHAFGADDDDLVMEPDDLDDEAPTEEPGMGDLPATDMAAFFGDSGPIAAVLEGYEARASQVAMAQAVKEALIDGKHALIEAPTGTGKSLAYLAPAVLSGRQVVIATANKSLQAQLYLKDIPFLAQAMGVEIDAVLVKGRSNYLCLHKWENEQQETKQILLYDREPDQIKGIRLWLQETESGDVDELPFVIEPELRPRVVSYPDDCIGRQCDFFDRCFVENMRNRAAESQVVITNHHLLLNALELGAAGERLLPPASIYVVDEAHGLEQTATSVFETMVTDYTVEQLLARTILKRLAEEAVLDEDELEETRFQNTLAFQEVRLKSNDNSFIIEGELEEIRKLSTRLSDLARKIRQANPYGDPTDGEDRKLAQQRLLLAHTTELLNGTANSLALVASAKRDGVMVRFAQKVFDRKRVTIELHAAPINPAGLLSKFLFDPEDEGGPAGRRVICTSATLSTAGSFTHFRARCGIVTPTVEAVLAPVFDYEQQALLYQPPLPAFEFRAPDPYYVAVAGEIDRLLQVSRGRALCLFTSWSGMQHVAQRLTPRGETGLIWPVRCQGDAPREALLAWFRATPYSVLLATRSFWEGVDIPGDDLSLVVLDKLPFPTPNDPLTRARMEAIKSEGRDDFGDYMVPLMTLALKQGFGRLIRRTSDRGVVAILDERISSKGYGRQVRRDLPPARYSRDYKDVHRFFQTALASEAEFALNLWAWPDAPSPGAATGAPVGGRWQWQLVRLVDGKAGLQAGTYAAPARPESPGADEMISTDLAAVEGELLALEHALTDLRGRVERGGRAPSDFAVEVRCRPATALWLRSSRIAGLRTPVAHAQARAAAAAWRKLHLVGIAPDSAEAATL